MTEREVSGLTEVSGLRVARGRVTDEEAAAVVTVLMARLHQEAAAAAPAAGPVRTAASAWCDRSSLLRDPISPSPGGWRRSALPGF